MTDVSSLLGLTRPPVAIAFMDSPPAGVERWQGGETPAGCSFWKAAQAGRVFYTVPADHYNCAVGAYTHRVPLPENRADELNQTVGFMVRSGYLRMEEVAGIPTLGSTPAVIVYASVDRAPFAPDVVIVSASPAQAMLLYEAVARAGANGAIQALGRPACAVIPLSIQSESATISLGCKGNRTFTGLPDGELYLSIPGKKWPEVVQQIGSIVASNRTMESHYTGHRASFAEV